MAAISSISTKSDPCDKVQFFTVDYENARICFTRRDDRFSMVCEESAIWERIHIDDLSKEEFNQIIIKMTALQHDEVNKE